ncbi:hypothetical protein WDW89_09475 [Deltaproteobacteria bacterium TL4]
MTLPNSYDGDELISRIENLSYEEIKLKLQKEVSAVEKTLNAKRGAPKARKKGAEQYARFIKGTIFCLSQKTVFDLPPGLGFVP